MKMIRSGRVRAILIGAAVLQMTACQPKLNALTKQETQHMKTLTANMTPRCFGRYLVDLPQDFELNTEGGQTIDGVTIDIKAMTKAMFHKMLEERKRKLDNQTIYGEPNNKTLKNILPIKNAIGVVFDRAETPESNVLRTLELRGWRDGYFFQMQVNARDMTYSTRNIPDDTRETTTPEKLAQLLDVFKRTHGRTDSEIPTGQGVCILNGFVSGPPTDQEEVGSNYNLKTADDVYFTFSTLSLFAEDDTLLDRVPALEPVLKEGDGGVLRKGRRETNGIKGEELLYTVRGDDSLLENNPMTHKFIFEANGKIGSASTPAIRVDFYNGVRKPEPERKYDDDFPPPITKATLSEAEAVALWDTIIPTIRRRPGAF